MGDAPERAFPGFTQVGPKDALARFLNEYELAEEDIEGLVAARNPPTAGGAPGPAEYLVHQSLLRSHGEFPCAGDAEALGFCREIAAEMADLFGIAPGEAVARINRHWSQPGDEGPAPRVWIVGLDLVYHEDPDFWARCIYYGPDARLGASGIAPIPLPPP